MRNFLLSFHFTITFLLLSGAFQNTVAQEVRLCGRAIGCSGDSLPVLTDIPSFEYTYIHVRKDSSFCLNFMAPGKYAFILLGKCEIVCMAGETINVVIENDSLVQLDGRFEKVNQLMIAEFQKKPLKIVDCLSLLPDQFRDTTNLWVEQKKKVAAIADLTDEEDLLFNLMLRLQQVYYLCLYSYAQDAGGNYEKLTVIDQNPEFFPDNPDVLFRDTLVVGSVIYGNALLNYQRYQIRMKGKPRCEILMTGFEIAVADPLPGRAFDQALLNLNYFMGTSLTLDEGSFFTMADSVLAYFSIHARYEKDFRYFEKSFMKNYSHLRKDLVMDEFAFEDSTGKIIRLSDYKNSVVVINLWGTWCKGCIQAMPEYNDLIEKYANQNVVFISIAHESASSVDEYKAAVIRWKRLVAKLNIQGVCLVTTMKEGMGKYNINNGFPKHMVLDRGNLIKDLDAGSFQDVDGILLKLLEAH